MIHNVHVHSIVSTIHRITLFSAHTCTCTLYTVLHVQCICIGVPGNMVLVLWSPGDSGDGVQGMDGVDVFGSWPLGVNHLQNHYRHWATSIIHKKKIGSRDGSAIKILNKVEIITQHYPLTIIPTQLHIYTPVWRVLCNLSVCIQKLYYFIHNTHYQHAQNITFVVQVEVHWFAGLE